MINNPNQEKQSNIRKLNNEKLKAAKPPISQQDKFNKQKKDQPTLQKSIVSSKSSSDLSLKENQNDSSTQYLQVNSGLVNKPQTLEGQFKKAQQTDSQNKKVQVKRNDISSDANRSQYSSNSNLPQLSMLKKSQVSVYGSEAGIKPITKNPWASIKTNEDEKPTKSLKSMKSTNLRSQSPQNSKKIVKGIQSNSKSSLLEQKDQTTLGNQMQFKKLVNQGINFGSFSQISQKYLENQYQVPSQKNDELSELYIIRKINNISEQLQVNQKRKIQKEIKLLNLQYDIFLNDQALKEKLLKTQKLNEFLQSSQNLSQQYDQIVNLKQENGNYVRINFEGRSIFLDILKQNASFSFQIQKNADIMPEQAKQKDLISIQDKRAAILTQLCVWDNPKNIFSIENQISQIEKVDSFIEYLVNLYHDLNKQFQEILNKQQFL